MVVNNVQLTAVRGIHMEVEVESLISHIRNQNNPLVVANKISYFIADALKGDKLNLYNAYLLHWAEIRLRRIGYMQLSWGGRVRTATCLALVNQKLLAHLFDDHAGAKKLGVWGKEASHLNLENRPHYIMDKYNQYLHAVDTPELLERLQSVRERYDALSEEDGPYHTEVFPYHYYSPEKLLMEKKGHPVDKGSIDEVVETLIVEISMR
jgi:hypothetical protein